MSQPDATKGPSAAELSLATTNAGKGILADGIRQEIETATFPLAFDVHAFSNDCINEWSEILIASNEGQLLHVLTMSVRKHVHSNQNVSLPELKHAPVDKVDRLAGDAAARFAKTLRSKIQRGYHDQPHVRGLPFALALADFHGGSTMVWSREALPTYLYGKLPVVKEGERGRYAFSEYIDKLKGHDIKAGLFNDPEMRSLSAIVFSNACTIAKFNRMGVLAGLGVPGVQLRRKGILYDRTPGALEPIDFDMNVESEEYLALWPRGEAWCVELEVYHNPGATHPFPFDLLPGATHWFERDGEIVCDTMWERTVLASMTTILAPKELQRWPAKGVSERV